MAVTNRELIDEWATETLKRLIVSVHTALMDKPPELPDYLESEIESREFGQGFGLILQRGNNDEST